METVDACVINLGLIVFSQTVLQQAIVPALSIKSAKVCTGKLHYLIMFPVFLTSLTQFILCRHLYTFLLTY